MTIKKIDSDSTLCNYEDVLMATNNKELEKSLDSAEQMIRLNGEYEIQKEDIIEFRDLLQLINKNTLEMSVQDAVSTPERLADVLYIGNIIKHILYITIHARKQLFISMSNPDNNIDDHGTPNINKENMIFLQYISDNTRYRLKEVQGINNTQGTKKNISEEIEFTNILNKNHTVALSNINETINSLSNIIDNFLFKIESNIDVDLHGSIAQLNFISKSIDKLLDLTQSDLEDDNIKNYWIQIFRKLNLIIVKLDINTREKYMLEFSVIHAYLKKTSNNDIRKQLAEKKGVLENILKKDQKNSVSYENIDEVFEDMNYLNLLADFQKEIDIINKRIKSISKIK